MRNFGGFTGNQMEAIARKMGFEGPMDKFNEFLAASPGKSAQLSQYTSKAIEALNRPVVKMAKGGLLTAQIDMDKEKKDKAKKEEKEKVEPEVPLNKTFNQVTNSLIDNPTNLTTEAKVVNQELNKSELIDKKGATAGDAATADAKVVGKASTATASEQPKTATMKPTLVGEEADKVIDKTKAAQGKIDKEDLAKVRQLDPEELAQLGLKAPTIGNAASVNKPDPRIVQKGELVSGTGVSMGAVDDMIGKIAPALADPTTQATVQGQLEGLMQDFEGGKTPPWAAGAMRQASAAMAARGLSASSMAGMAVVQAAMESALPIAAQDASTYAQFESQNLSNRQQVVMMAAEQRAQFLGQKFDQAFQRKVFNASQIAEIANMNFTADVQIALENAQLVQTTKLANLDSRSAKVLADAAAMTQIQSQNLNNRQQAALQNAQSFLAMDMANLDNKQQTNLFKTQSRLQTLFTDQAADNAAKQFNASNENQANQFFAQLETQVSQFNAAQRNSIKMSNADNTNAVRMFNAQVVNARDEFNANNRLIIDQANAKWRQMVNTNNNATANETNRLNAQLATGMTTAAYNNMWQKERDIMSYAFTASENAAQRANEIVLQKLGARSSGSSAVGEAAGGLLSKVADRAIEAGFDYFGF